MSHFIFLYTLGGW